MKLSEITGERALTVIADVLPPIFRMSSDPEVLGLLDKNKRKRKKGETDLQAGMRWLSEAIQPLLVGHKDDVIAVLSALDNVTPEEYIDSLNFLKLAQDVSDLVTDPMVRMLFFSRTQTSGDTSGSASETTEGPTEQ